MPQQTLQSGHQFLTGPLEPAHGGNGKLMTAFGKEGLGEGPSLGDCCHTAGLAWPTLPSLPRTNLWLKCCSRTSLPFSTRTSRMWMALIFRWAFP